MDKSQEKEKGRHDQHEIEKTFYVGDRVWLYFNKESLQEQGNKIKDKYVPFKILDKVRNNSYRLGMGKWKKLRVSFGALDAIENWKNKHTSTCMDILRHLHNESCDE